MIIFSECFQDQEIKSIISKTGQKGTCPVCETKHVYLYDTEKDSRLTSLFEQLISVYTPQKDFPPDIGFEAELLPGSLYTWRKADRSASGAYRR